MPLPAAIPFILAGMGALISSYTAATATGLIKPAQSKQAAANTEARRDSAMAARAANPTLPKPKTTTPIPQAKPSNSKPTSPAAPQPSAKVVVPETTLPQVSAEPPASSSPAPTPIPPVKAANIETILFNDEEFSSEFLVDLLFENVAGQELLTIARNDTVNGQDVTYQPIKNLNILQDTYNPTKLLAVSDTSESFFGSFAIDLRTKIPSIKTDTDAKNYYITELGDLVIEVVNIGIDEQVEFQIADSGTIEELGI